MKLWMIKRLTAALLCVAMLAGIPALAVFEDDALPAIPAAPEVDAVVELPEEGDGKGAPISNNPDAPMVVDENGGVQLLDTPLYCLTYHSNGGEWTKETTSKYGLTAIGSLGSWPDWASMSDAVITEANFPVREGYTFLGWNRNPSATVAELAPGAEPPRYYSDWDSYITSDDYIVLYAVWQGNPCTLAYDANGGTGAPENVASKVGELASISAKEPVKSGCVFCGWNTDPAAQTGEYTGGSQIEMAGDTTLYAIWQKEQIDVTVPTTLPIHMDAYGNVTCGDIVITNNGTESVVVEDAQITALNNWTLVDYDTTTFTDANEGQHKVALQLGSLDSAIAANGGQKTIDLEAKIPYQGVRMTNASIAQVVFVLGVQAPDASIDWEYTTDDTTNTITLTKYIGESNDVVVHDKYYVGGKTYKTALDVSAYYRRGPFNISDKQSYITRISFNGEIILPADMKEVFNNCSALTNVDGLDGWDTSDVTKMSSMFYCCSSLTNIDGISGWDTSNVTTMGSMFSGCRSLISLDLRAFNTSKVTDMGYMFSGCSSLVYLDLTGWDLSALSEKSKMFSGCTNLTSVYVKDQATKDKLDSGTDKPSTCAIIVAGIEITGNTSVNVGETIQLSVTKNLPPSVAENAVTWSTSNSNIATVNGSGLVTGVSAGTATITASCNGVTATHTVSVESQIPADFDEACDILFLVTGYNTDGTVSYEKTWCAYGMDYSGNRGGCGKYDSTLSDVVSESGTIRIKALKAPSYLWFPSGWSFLTSYGSSCYKISEYGEGDWTNVTLKNSEGAFSGYVSFKASGGTTQP